MNEDIKQPEVDTIKADDITVKADDVKVAETKPVEEKETKSYVQIQKEKAAEKARKEVLAELGVTDIEVAKAKLMDGEKALQIATEVKQKIEAEENARITLAKENALKNLYKETFDPEVLVRLTNLAEVELDATGNIIGGADLLEKVKAERPHFFGTARIGSDTVAINTGTPKVADPIAAAYAEGNYQAAVKEHLKSILKK